MVAAAGAFYRTPFSLLLPGQSLDLRTVITVRGHAVPASRYDLTDVRLEPDASPLELLEKSINPGTRIVPTTELIPAGMSDETYERATRDLMRDSQDASIYVAERAAGLPVGTIRERVFVADVMSNAPAHGVLKAGDTLVAIDGTTIESMTEALRLTGARAPGATARVTFKRGERVQTADVRTISLNGKARMGIYLEAEAHYPQPPVPVTFSTGDISGSSGGLMFAIDIYRSLRPSKSAPLHVAGTGTLDTKGNVGAIEGTVQKLAAARRAGATVFLVPVDNYVDIKDVRDIRIIPVRTFAEAIRAIGV